MPFDPMVAQDLTTVLVTCIILIASAPLQVLALFGPFMLLDRQLEKERRERIAKRISMLVLDDVREFQER